MTNKFRMSVTEGVIELEGTEEFVTTQLKNLHDLIEKAADKMHGAKVLPAPITPAHQDLPVAAHTTTTIKIDTDAQSQNSASAQGISKYPNSFEMINGVLRVVADIPGDSKKAKQVNAALLYGYGSMLLAREVVSTDEVRDLCQHHGFLDPGNFSKIFDDKTIFVMEGAKGAKKSMKLSHQGKKQALTLLTEIETNAG